MPSIRLFSPAKINFYLHVVGKRPDGFHELETLMVPIDFGDHITVEAELSDQTELALTCTEPSLSCDEDNLAIRAARSFLETYGLTAEVSIHIEKQLPVGGGLGGGSSNGATVLLALRQLLLPESTDEELAKLAAQFGSDTSFFIYQTPAICRGRGEIIEPITLRQTYHGLLVRPGFGVSTPWAFKTYASDPKVGESGAELEDGTVLRNDLEPPVFSKYLWLPMAKTWIQEQEEVVDALMSGSGSSLFAITKNRMAAEALAKRFSSEFGDETLVRPFSVKP